MQIHTYGPIMDYNEQELHVTFMVHADPHIWSYHAVMKCCPLCRSSLQSAWTVLHVCRPIVLWPRGKTGRDAGGSWLPPSLLQEPKRSAIYKALLYILVRLPGSSPQAFIAFSRKPREISLGTRLVVRHMQPVLMHLDSVISCILVLARNIDCALIW